MNAHLLDHCLAAFGRGPAGAPVGNLPAGVQGAEVAADRDVLRANLKIDAQRFEDAPADPVLERVVAEQAQMPRPAARRVARQHRQTQAADALLGAPVEVRRARGFQLRLAARLQRQAA